MADFTSSFWSILIGAVTLVSIVVLIWFNWAQSRPQHGKKPAAGEEVETMGHVWDGDLAEFNNPLPGWWRKLFYITLFWGLLYLLLYPGLGAFPGLLKWTSHKQYQEEMADAAKEYGPIFDRYQKEDILKLVDNPAALAIGKRLFATYCTQCHGSDAGGARGFPNLTDNDWLYGGTPDAIQTTILNGRSGVMPAWGPVLGDEKVKQVAAYVEHLSGRHAPAADVDAGKKIFDTYCVACHGPTGTGNQMLGAPNLTDDIWLYGGSDRTIVETITKGRQGHMPAHREFLGEAKVHLLAAYVYSLSKGHAPAQ